MSDFVINGTLVSDVKRAKPYTNADGTAGILVEHNDGTESTFPLPDATTANLVYNAVVSVRGAVNVSKPVISSITPVAILTANLPATITIAGSNFDSSAVITLVAYNQTSKVLTTSFQNSGLLTATVPSNGIVIE
jgi:IPT/TIG domain